MDFFLKTTFLIIMVFSLINLLMSISIYFSSKKQLYLQTGLFWFFLILNFLIQSVAQEDEFKIILGFSFSMIPLNMLSYLSLYLKKEKYPFKFFIPFSLSVILLTFLIKDLNISFTLKALPLAMATALPLVYSIYVYLRKKEKMSLLMKLHSFVIMMLVVHCINFAFFRMVPDAQIWGWLVAYGLYQTLAMIIPSLSLDYYHNEEKIRLENEIELRTKELIEQTEKNAELKINYLNAKIEKNLADLSSSLTHEINTPLTTIQGYTSLIKEKEKESQFEIKKIQEQVIKIKEITNMLGLLSKDPKQNNSGNSLSSQEIIESIDFYFENRLKNSNVKLVFSSNKNPVYDINKQKIFYLFSEIIKIFSSSSNYQDKLLIKVEFNPNLILFSISKPFDLMINDLQTMSAQFVAGNCNFEIKTFEDAFKTGISLSKVNIEQKVKNVS